MCGGCIVGRSSRCGETSEEAAPRTRGRGEVAWPGLGVRAPRGGWDPEMSCWPSWQGPARGCVRGRMDGPGIPKEVGLSHFGLRTQALPRAGPRGDRFWPAHNVFTVCCLPCCSIFWACPQKGRQHIQSPALRGPSTRCSPPRPAPRPLAVALTVGVVRRVWVLL